MDARQENYLRYYEEDLNGRNAEAWKYYKKEYANDPGDLFINTTGMVIALEYLNDPETALLLNQEIASDSLDLNVCVYCRTRVALAMQAFEDLGDKKNANKLAEQLRPYAEKPAQLTRLIKHYVSTGDTAAVNEMIMKGVKAGSKPDDEQYYFLIAARYAMINGNINMRDRYATRAIQLYGSSVNRTKARCHYLLGDYARAEKIYLAEISLKPDDSRLRAELGMIYSRQGNTAKAEEIISLLGRMKRPYGYGETEYFQARIKALAGEKEAAIALLQRALDDGMKFRVGTTFQHDPDLMALNTSPEYAKLLERYRQP
jgi:tetratricopeptide (TPR) repeat protein